MIYLKLFWSFLKIGFTSFGGLSMIPLISSEMLSNGWMNAQEVSDIIAIAEMTPGPVGLNCASFSGVRAAGVLGALAANLGVMTPLFTICLAAAVFFEKFKNAKFMQNIMIGIRPVCFALVIGICVELIPQNYISEGSLNISSALIALFDLLLLIKFKISIPKVILLNAVMGIIVYGALPLLL